MKNAFSKQLADLRASKISQHVELAEHVNKTYLEAINRHSYKVLYGGENSAYEFQCPISPSIMTIYKGEKTFEGYDFTGTHPNPRLREMVKTNSSLAEKYGSRC